MYPPDRPLCLCARSCIIPTPCKRAVLYQIPFHFLSQAHTSRRYQVLSFRGVVLGGGDVVIQRERRDHPTWHVQFHGISVPRLRALEQSADAPLA